MPNPEAKMVKEVEAFIRYINPDSLIHELRIFLPGGRIEAGLLDDANAMARYGSFKSVKHGAEGVYYSLNPVKGSAVPSLCAQELNMVQIRPRRTTGNGHIDSRALYLIDIDPVRPSGTCATVVEKATALEVADKIQAYLASLGWPEPILVDSGNGYHLLYRGDGCCADSEEWVYALKHLDSEFSTVDAHVDTCVGNPARISRLPGTWNRKGDNTPERPHRLSCVLNYPAQWAPLKHGHIYNLAHDHGCTSSYDRPPERRRCSGGLVIDDTGVHALIAEFPQVLHLRNTTTDGDTIYFLLAECPFAGRAHRSSDAGRRKTAILLSPSRIGFKCFSDECGYHTFGDLLNLLHARTGRWPSMRIWAEPDPSVLAAVWGGVDDLSNEVIESPEEEYFRLAWEGGHFDCLPDNYTPPAHARQMWINTSLAPAVLIRAFTHAALCADRLIEHQQPEHLSSFRAEISRITKLQDLYGIKSWIPSSSLTQLEELVSSSDTWPKDPNELYGDMLTIAGVAGHQIAQDYMGP